MEKILLVTIKLNYDKSGWTLEDLSREMEELIGATGAQIAGTITCNLAEPTPNYFIGRGKVDEIAAAVVADGIETVIFSHDLSGTQQRNSRTGDRLQDYRPDPADPGYFRAPGQKPRGQDAG
jgi:GTP-binding protein HflX